MPFTRMPTDYCLDASLPELEAWMQAQGYDPSLPLAVDIETPETDKIDEENADDPEKTSYTIIRCGFSFRCGTAASYPWSEPYITFTRNLINVAHTVIFHNGGFDRPRLERAGCRIAGTVHDTMWMFHFLQSDLPKSLEFVAPFYVPDAEPWKHLSQVDPAFYNARDNDYELRCFYGMRDWLIKQGRWERFTRHCSDTAAILGEMSTAGVLVDVAARQTLQEGLRSEIATLDSAIQAGIPPELLPVKELKTERTLAELPEEERAQWEACYVKCECKRTRKSTGQCIICDGTGMTVRFRKRLGFNWNSTDQCQELALHYGFKIPKKRGEDREALESKTLRSFGKRKPIFLDIWNARKRYKLISTYDWSLDETGRVHTKFGFHPSTWRKSSRDPNLQNIPKRNELAAAFRRTLVAAPGHVLIEADSAAIEAVLVGYCAQSPRYIRAAKAGIHDIFMSHVRAYREGGRGIDISLADEDLIAACRAAKKEDASRPLLEQIRDSCKRCIHGTNYGLSPFGMHDEYPDEFPSQKVATELQEMYLSLFPEIKSWMRKTREQADRQTFLDNHYQYRHYFYAVTKWDGRHCPNCQVSRYRYRGDVWDKSYCPVCKESLGAFLLGTDAKRCIAFLPQSDASAIQTEDLLTLAGAPYIRSMLRLIIHDSHVLECPIDMIDQACYMLYSTMSRPRPELGGLSIGVEIKYGVNLADTQVWKPSSEETEPQP